MPSSTSESDAIQRYLLGVLSRWICALASGIYVIWFYANRFLVDICKKHISIALGVVYGMLILEGHTIIKAAWYTLKTYRKDSTAHGFEEFDFTEAQHRPVLLLHGAVGSWSYLGDLATALKAAHIPVFVINLGAGQPTEEARQKVTDKIKEINSVSGDGLVDIVAHSNGGNLALYSIFTRECSTIDERGVLEFRDAPEANPQIGKVITIALPSDEEEVDWMRQINKVHDLFNINAQFDALMGHKQCALVKELSSHGTEVNAGHIGIVFQRVTYERVLQFLFEKTADSSNSS